MKRLLLKHISLILLFAFTTTNISSAYGLTGIGASSVILSEAEGRVEGSKDTNLAVQLPSKPVADPSIKSAMRLKSHVAYMSKIDDTFLETEGISHESNGVKIHFPDALSLNMNDDDLLDNFVEFRIIPCNVDKEILYLYHYKAADGEDQFAVQTFKQYEEFAQNIVNRNSMTASELKAVKEKLDLEEVNDISIVDPTDKSIMLVKEFFDSIRADILKNKFTEFIKWLPILSVKGKAASYETIVVDSDQDMNDKTWSIIEQFLEIMFDYDQEDDMKFFVEAFDVFNRNQAQQDKVIYSERLISRINDILSLITVNTSGVALNEGGITLHPSAYTQMIDLSDISMEKCENEKYLSGQGGSVVEDVRNIFDHVSKHYLEKLNKKLTEDKKLDIVDFPGFGDKLLIRNLSTGVLPTSVVYENGTIVLNENFIKMLYLIRELAFKEIKLVGERHDYSPFDRSLSPILGNLYDSIIYSLALHEITGHFVLEDDLLKFIDDESSAQKMRGRRTFYGNIIAMTIYWGVFVADSKYMTTGWWNDWVNKNPHLFERFTDSEMKNFVFVIINCIRSFETDFGPIENSFKRVPIPPMSTSKVADIFYAIALTDSIDVYELANALNMADPDKVQNWLDFLVDAGVVEKQIMKNEKVLPLPLYRIAKMPEDKLNDIKKILNTISEQPSKEDLEKNRNRIRAIAVTRVISTDKKVVNTDSVSPAIKPAWQDIARVFAFLTLQQGESITITELVDLIYKQPKGKEKRKYEELVSLSARSLIKLGIIRHDMKTSAYKLIPSLDPISRELVESLKYFLLSIEKTPLDKSINYSILSEKIQDIISGKVGTPIVDEVEPDVFWKNASGIFDVLSQINKPVSFSDCRKLSKMTSADTLEHTLDMLVKTGAILRYRPKGKEAYYAVRRLASKQKYEGVSKVLKNVTTGPNATDLIKLKTEVFAKYSMTRTWLKVLELVPLIISMNEVYMVLVKEGLEDNRKYTQQEVNDFYKELQKKYFGPDTTGTREQLISLLVDKHGLDTHTAALLDHRLYALQKFGRIYEPWTFNAGSISRYLRQVNDTLKEEKSKEEIELYELTSKVKEEALDIDLFILEELGVLSANDMEFNYSLAKFFIPGKIKERILKIGGKRLNVPVQSGHLQKIRDALFANVPPTWPIASFVFQSLQLEPTRTVKGEDLLANVNSGVDKGSWNMFSAVLEYLNRLGIVKDFTVPGKNRAPVTGEEFRNTEFSAIALSKDEMERFTIFVDDIGRLKQESFINVFPQKQDRIDLMQALFTGGYINNFRKVSSDFWEVASYKELEFSDYFENKKKLTADQRKEIYKKVEAAYMELTFSKDAKSIANMKQKFILGVLEPRPAGAFYVFEKIRTLLAEAKRKAPGSEVGESGYPSFSEILSAIDNISAKRLGTYLSYLKEIGLIEEIDERFFRPVRMYGVQMDATSKILSDVDREIDAEDDENIKSVTTKILSVTESLWAKRFLEDLSRVVSKISKDKAGGLDSKVLLAFDMSWIPAAQKKHVLDILRAVSKLHNITLVISETSENLPEKIEKEMGAISWKNVITFVNNHALVTETGDPGEFWKTYRGYDKRMKSHVIGIDNSNLSDDTYIRLLEMVSMAYEHAFNIWEEPLRHPHIEAFVTKTKDRPIFSRKYIIFTPDTEKIDIDHIPEVYRAQVKQILQSA